MQPDDNSKTLLDLTVKIVAAHVGHNEIAPAGLPALIEQVYSALKNVGTAPPAPVVAEKQAPFVPPKRSIFPDYIICLEDGRKLKTLKRHLRATFGLSPDQYREKWGLPPDYPMVAPNYAEHRSRLAKEAGLGRKVADEDVAEPDLAPVADALAAEAESAALARQARKRGEPTLDSVFAKFPKQEAAAAEVGPAPEAPKAKRGRKPFSKQLARTMPR